MSVEKIWYGLAAHKFIIAPMLGKMQSIFEYLQKVNGLYSVPIIGIFLLGITTKHVPEICTQGWDVSGMLFYSFFTFLISKIFSNFFLIQKGICIISMDILSAFFPQ
ncbi:MAG: hypothetical protein CM1200mP1_06590 [Candidatus Neomarinimicrobiota bacterium]|nr:MAG: hypothetical protein CM1200mP1_06590 [Candidatus Neomarinimicrobiota bacterium]